MVVQGHVMVKPHRVKGVMVPESHHGMLPMESNGDEVFVFEFLGD
jgi:hypothetical protein